MDPLKKIERLSIKVLEYTGLPIHVKYLLYVESQLDFCYLRFLLLVTVKEGAKRTWRQLRDHQHGSNESCQFLEV